MWALRIGGQADESGMMANVDQVRSSPKKPEDGIRIQTGQPIDCHALIDARMPINETSEEPRHRYPWHAAARDGSKQ